MLGVGKESQELKNRISRRRRILLVTSTKNLNSSKILCA